MIEGGDGKPSHNIAGDGKPKRIVAKGPNYDDLWAVICEEEDDLKKSSSRPSLERRLAEVRAKHSPPAP